MKGPHSEKTKWLISKKLKAYAKTEEGKTLLTRITRLAAEKNRNQVSDFEANIDRSGDCWIWEGPVTAGGYGAFMLDRVQGTHRIAWSLAHKERPGPRTVRHLCHNRLCCNPKHLEIGTTADNARDMVNADRQAKGINNGRAVLSEEQIKAIRKMLNEGKSQSSIGRVMGVSQVTISHIKLGKRWKHVQ